MADHASFDILDEFINDENTLVTYKWLSRTNGIHVNEAKSLLAQYVNQKKSAGDGNLNVIYCVTGMKKHDDDSVSHHVFLVADDKLNDVRDSLSQVTTCHVYSVQKNKLKDSNALYIADFDKLKENIGASNRYSAVQNPRAKYRAEAEIRDKKSTVIPKHDKEPEKNPEPAKPKPNLFSNAKKSGETTKKVEKKVDKKGKQNSINFKKSSPPASKVPPDSGKGKKTPRADDSDDEVRTTKRRKVKLIESSSEEEEEDTAPSPVPSPPAPPRVPTPEPNEKPVPMETEKENVAMETDDKSEKVAEKENEKAENNNGGEKKKRRVRKKKLVPKTFMDDEGFMVTEKVWESDSTDASDTEDVKPAPKAAPPPPRAKTAAKESSKGGKGKKSAAPAASGKKQASLMNFFSKK